MAETKEMAEACLEQLQKSPENFAELGKSVSKCSSGSAKGGDLGWVREGEMVAPVNNVFFVEPLPEGQMAVVETEFGWHVVQVNARRVARGYISVPQFLERFEIDDLREEMQ